jgi:hypothetical protein
MKNGPDCTWRGRLAREVLKRGRDARGTSSQTVW